MQDRRVLLLLRDHEGVHPRRMVDKAAHCALQIRGRFNWMQVYRGVVPCQRFGQAIASAKHGVVPGRHHAASFGRRGVVRHRRVQQPKERLDVTFGLVKEVEQAMRCFNARVDLRLGVLAHRSDVGLLLALMLDSGLCSCFRNCACALLFSGALLRLYQLLLADALYFRTHEFLGAHIIALALLLRRLAIATAKQCQGQQ